MVAYDRKFIVDFSDRAASLCDLLKKGKQFVWPEACEISFAYLKEQLQSIGLLIHPHFPKPFVLTTDASDNAVGFTLCQEVQGELLPVLDGGRTLTKSNKSCYFFVKKCQVLFLGD